MMVFLLLLLLLLLCVWAVHDGRLGGGGVVEIVRRSRLREDEKKYKIKKEHLGVLWKTVREPIN